GGDASCADAIRKEVRSRLWAANSLLNGLRETLAGCGVPPFAWPPKFKLPAAFDYRDPLLSRLAFVTRYESVVRYVEVRSGRSTPMTERLASGAALRVTFLGADQFRLDPAQGELRIDTGGFPNWLLHADTDAGHRAALAYDDFANRARV